MRGLPTAAICALAGFLFAVSANTAHGVDLRADQRTRLADVVAARQQSVAGYRHKVTGLQDQLDARAAADPDAPELAGLAAQQSALGPAVGLTPVHGAGVAVTLDDAPVSATDPRDVDPNAFLVHQQDVEAVVNALWAGGARAVAVNGERIVATSVILCAGNTLLLDGRTYPTPYVIEAVGSPPALQAALSASPGVQNLMGYVETFHVRYDVATSDDVSIAAYDGPLQLRYATPANSKPANSKPADSKPADSPGGTP